MSTTKLTNTNPVAATSTPPWIIGKLRLLTASRPVEHELDDVGAPEHEAGLQTDQRHERQRRDLQPVDEQHATLGQPAGACRADVVFAERFEERQPHGSNEHRRQHHHERRYRQHEAFGPGLVDRRQPRVLDREDEDEHDGEPEVRRRLCERDVHEDGAVDESVCVERGEDAERETEDRRDHHRQSGELQRVRERAEHRIAH
jgi:hypothetical protein